MRAINHANRICDWQENLGEEEMPPRWMWPFEDSLKDWFENVKLAREEKYSGAGGDDSGMDESTMMSNELADSFR